MTHKQLRTEFTKPSFRKELENKLGKSYEEINADKSIKVDVKFKFIYE